MKSRLVHSMLALAVFATSCGSPSGTVTADVLILKGKDGKTVTLTAEDVEKLKDLSVKLEAAQAEANKVVEAAQIEKQLTQCSSNLKNQGTAMEMYSTDYSGRYPTSLQDLTPNYLRAVMTCPTGGSYSMTSDVEPDVYRITCNGDHTTSGLARGFPQYDSVMGLLREPAP